MFIIPLLLNILVLILMLSRVFTLLVCIVAVTLALPDAIAASTGILAGTITDLDGNGIQGVSVSLYRGQNLVIVERKPQTTIGDPSIGPIGHYGIKGLSPGRYKVVVRKSTGAGLEYTAEQQVSVTTGTVIQDIVLDIPGPTSQPVTTYDPFRDAPPTNGFGAPILVLSLVVALLLLSRRER
jgi:hypothetical protein